MDSELIERNCASGIRAPVEKVDRERVLTDVECASYGPPPAARPRKSFRWYFKILRLLLLTAQRRGEVGMPRPELDLDRGTWGPPGTRNSLPHEVPLSRQVKDPGSSVH